MEYTKYNDELLQVNKWSKVRGRFSLYSPRAIFPFQDLRFLPPLFAVRALFTVPILLIVASVIRFYPIYVVFLPVYLR